MDPRTRRSRDRLTRAVLEVAAQGRLDDVSVSEVARAARVTRDTFYRHASSVPNLLALALTEKLQQLSCGSSVQAPEFVDLAEVLRRGELELIHHIVDHAAVYRTALGARSAAPVRRAIVEVLRVQLANALSSYPALSPLGAADFDEREFDMITSYTASGIIAAVEVWLESDDPTDVEQAVRIIVAGSPRWWLIATGRLEHSDGMRFRAPRIA